MWRRLHRWLAIVLVIPLIVWSLTGLLFHLKPGWGRAYDLLDPERPGTVALGPVAAALADAPVTHVELFDTAIGPLARVTTPQGDALYDCASGTKKSPLPIDAAKALAVDAIARSPHRADYGSIVSVASTDTTVTLDLGDIAVTIGRNDARLSQHGADTARIDWLYRIHYLQWTGNKALDKVLAILGLVLIWLVLIPGVVLFVRRR